ncbi:hypothetical protein PV327_009374 [Microctonus hyperodae]|uniref:Mitochondrial mRNA-processing protein COX24 C-terminal domain-containing protein n=1 Tax=Microctonus hyperodae TaxID=165561 RepID=A0AA39FTX2_MICHY|nr:hypothetical protein PV327_009374 [Microctonus hyperodae]
MSAIWYRCFKQFNVSVRGIVTLKYSTSCHQQNSKSKISFCHQPSMHFRPGFSSIFEPNLRFTANHSIIDIGFPQIRKINEIIDNPKNSNVHIIEPPQISQSIEDKIPEKSLDLPAIGVHIEKQAVRLIVIRRRKMKKHKRRKMRKRLTYVLRKIKGKRELNREKAFHEELLVQIRAAEKFDAKEYVASRLEILDKERVPLKWQGVILPEEMIRKLIKEKREKEEQKRNKPRLTL